MPGGPSELIATVAYIVLEVVVRAVVSVAVTPFVLLWPRKDRSEGYWVAVRRRYAGALASVWGN
ncbi:MAG: hypothetical protein AAFY08_13350 [Planctomycetota bacterium]